MTETGRSQSASDDWLALVVRRAVTETLPQTTPAQTREITERVAKWLRQSDYRIIPFDAARYVCPPCARGDHHRCSEPGVCRCTINPDTGEDEATDDARSQP